MISRHIIKHIFSCFGVPPKTGTFSVFSDQFEINKELSIELEDGEHVNKTVWATAGKIAASTIKIVATDLALEEGEHEYVIISQLDDLSVYAITMNSGSTENNKAFCLHGENWIELSNLLLAKFLVGVEQLNELFVDYQPMPNYQELYKHLISFLNYEEVSDNNVQQT